MSVVLNSVETIKGFFRSEPSMWQNFSNKTYHNKNRAAQVASYVGSIITLGLLPALVAIVSAIKTKMKEHKSSKTWVARFTKFVSAQVQAGKKRAITLVNTMKSHKKTTAAVAVGTAAAIGAAIYFTRPEVIDVKPISVEPPVSSAAEASIATLTDTSQIMPSPTVVVEKTKESAEPIRTVSKLGRGAIQLGKSILNTAGKANSK